MCTTASAEFCLKFGAWLAGFVTQGRDPRVTDRSSSVSGVAERYASALFDLARDESAIDRIEADLTAVQGLLDESADFRRLVGSPVFSAEDQQRAIGAVADKAGIGGLTGNFLRLIAKNRRLFALPGIAKAFHEMAARHRGEVTAEVTSAHPLNDLQVASLKAALKDRLKKDVTLQARVNPALLGGLVVKVGSRMIDTSLRTRLMNVKTQLKEVG
jgi:F-type H+-transporting ATPase subunit delta